jgi:hypothetical protein
MTGGISGVFLNANDAKNANFRRIYIVDNYHRYIITATGDIQNGNKKRFGKIKIFIIKFLFVTLLAVIRQVIFF